MRELSNGLITEEGLRIEWLDHLPAQLRVVLSVNSESSLDTLAAMADKMLEYSEPTTIAAVQSSHTTYTPNTADVTVSAQLCVLSKQLEKLSLEVAELRGRQQERRPYRGRPRSRSRSWSRQRQAPRPGTDTWECKYHWRFGDRATRCESPCCKRKKMSEN
ncbi:unnamed protein product [Plutella xylostella]|nr:unnamed protein product [Plutella xylostella]